MSGAETPSSATNLKHHGILDGGPKCHFCTSLAKRVRLAHACMYIKKAEKNQEKRVTNREEKGC